ncbi:hypothetical protein INR49_028339, partial [Caranx melampygus]
MVLQASEGVEVEVKVEMVDGHNKMAPNSIHWFRKGLRLHDNPALREAVRGADTVRCVYFLDPWFAGSSNVGVNRW